MSFQVIASELRRTIQRPLDAALPAGAEVAWPNAAVSSAVQDQAKPWAAVDIQWASVQLVGFGSGRRIRHRGSIEAVLVWPSGSGEGGLLAAADQIAAALTNTSAGLVRIQQPELLDADAGDGWEARGIRFGWVAEETKATPGGLLPAAEGTWATGSSALRQSLSAVVAAATGLSVVHGNAPQESPPVTKACVYADVLTGAQIPNQASQPADATKLGALALDIVTPAGSGTALALTLADQIADALALARSGSVEMGAAIPSAQQLLGPSWVTRLLIPYQLTHAL